MPNGEKAEHAESWNSVFISYSDGMVNNVLLTPNSQGLEVRVGPTTIPLQIHLPFLGIKDLRPGFRGQDISDCPAKLEAA